MTRFDGHSAFERACETWHRTTASGLTVYFRLVGGAEGQMLIYRVGPRPVEELATTVWCHGTDAVPCVCGFCGQHVPA